MHPEKERLYCLCHNLHTLASIPELKTNIARYTPGQILICPSFIIPSITVAHTIVRFNLTNVIEIDQGTFTELVIVLLSPIPFRQYISIDLAHRGREQARTKKGG